MDKEKFDNAAFKIVTLLKNKSSEFNMRFSPDIPQEIVTNANNYIDNYLDREIVKAAREIIAAAGDDIAKKPKPAESSPENKGYLPNTYFANNGSQYTD